jgi:SAM-dependent methyltransferase
MPTRRNGKRSAARRDDTRDLQSARMTYIKLVGMDPVLIPLESPQLRAMEEIFMRAFGRPRGVLGELGGKIMAGANAECGAWVTDLLEISPDDSVLEVGFGPGVIIQRLSELATTGYVAGIDQSRRMVKQARARNADAIRGGRVDLRCGSVDCLPFGDDIFDKALAINSMQVWPAPVAGLREIRRVMKPAGRIALGFTPYSGQPREGLRKTLLAAGFTGADVVERDNWFCALATSPCTGPSSRTSRRKNRET